MNENAGFKATEKVWIEVTFYTKWSQKRPLILSIQASASWTRNDPLGGAFFLVFFNCIFPGFSGAFFFT